MKPPIRLVFIRHADELDSLTASIADGVLLSAQNFANPWESGWTMTAFGQARQQAMNRGLACYALLEGIVYEADVPLLDEWLIFLDSVFCDGVFCFDETVGLRSRSIAADLRVIYHPITLMTHAAEADFYGSQGFFGVVASVDLSFEEAVQLASRSSTNVGFMFGTVPMYVSTRRLVHPHDPVENRTDAFSLQEGSRPGRFFPVAQNERGTMILRDAFVGLPANTSWRELPFSWLIGFRGPMPFEKYVDSLRRIWGCER